MTPEERKRLEYLEAVVANLTKPDARFFTHAKPVLFREGVNIHIGTGTGTQIGTTTTSKIGFFGETPRTQREKAAYNNWTNATDVASALADLGLVDTA